MSEAENRIAGLRKRAATLRGFAARNQKDFELTTIEFYRRMVEQEEKEAAGLEAEADAARLADSAARLEAEKA